MQYIVIVRDKLGNIRDISSFNTMTYAIRYSKKMYMCVGEYICEIKQLTKEF